jgi:hypothetical protein
MHPASQGYPTACLPIGG